MSTKRCAVLLDTVGIQKYVFNSNKLRENLGASYLVENIYNAPLKQTLQEIGIKLFEDWEDHPEKNDAPNQIGYIGGGSALLLFENVEIAQRFIREYTTRLLIEAPGIVPAIAVDSEFDISDQGFKKSKAAIFEQMRINKNWFIPQTVLPRHGITAECSSSGLSLDVWHEYQEGEDERNRYVSALTEAKLNAVLPAKNKLVQKYEALLEKYTEKYKTELKSKGFELKKFQFTDELDQLGQSQHEDNYIAIVHIDGNGIGEKFKGTSTLKQIRILSREVRQATQKAFEKLLEEFFKNFESIQKEFELKPDKHGKLMLPIRPIIIGGDDVTFVCPGKLGIYFAKIFLENFEKEKITDGNESIHHDACAGIAITKTKYPFYRGYELAEALCKSAKKRRKDDGGRGSYLDFHIAYGGFTGTLKDIREAHYRGVQGSLLIRPYPLNGGKYDSFETLLRNTHYLIWKDAKNNVVNFPTNKQKELRKTLILGENVTNALMMQLKEKGIDFNGFQVEKVFKDNFFNFPKAPEKSKTPYFDMIELKEFYPEFELKKYKGDVNE
ncbi:Cas10/Cmr2 second palm domain-containing protein [Calditrichota bacterium LG25]